MEGYVVVNPQTAHCDQYINEELLVSCQARYPEFHSEKYREVLIQINQYYRERAHQLCAMCAGELRQGALEERKERADNPDFPFNPYGGQLDYTLTFNRDCTISLYMDEYTFTGGAHGSTVREGDSWNLQTGARMTLGQLFPNDPDYRNQIIAYIQQQIKDAMARGEGDYFEDPPTLVAGAFDPEQFYLTPRGVVIFFQQYDIAPYVMGIPEFLIPWGTDGASAPECR